MNCSSMLQNAGIGPVLRTGPIGFSTLFLENPGLLHRLSMLHGHSVALIRYLDLDLIAGLEDAIELPGLVDMHLVPLCFLMRAVYSPTVYPRIPGQCVRGTTQPGPVRRPFVPPLLGILANSNYP